MSSCDRRGQACKYYQYVREKKKRIFFTLAIKKKTCGNPMERTFSSSIGLGHMADTSGKGSSDKKYQSSHDQPADVPKRPFVQGIFRDRTPPPSSLLPIPIQFPFSPKDALNGEPASFSSSSFLLQELRARTAAQDDLSLDPLESSMGEMRCDATCLVP